MRFRCAGLCFAVLVMIMLALPVAADPIINIYENGAEISYTLLPYQVALGDILLCEPNYQCPGFSQGPINPSDPMWSDLLRFANVPSLGGYVAILYSDPMIPFFVYGPNDIDKMIADGFALPGDYMGGNSGLAILETAPYTEYANYHIYSDVNESEVPEPASLLLFGTGILAIGRALRERLSH